MALTAGDVARSALSAVDSNAGLLQAVRWVSDRYRQLSNRGKLRALRKIQKLIIPAAITDGTATFTRGSSIVYGDATAQAAWNAGRSTVNQDNILEDTDSNPSVVGRYIRYSRVWYKIVSVENQVVGTIQLRLESPVADTSSGGAAAVSGTVPSGTGVAYKLVQRHTRLPQDTRFVGRFVQERLWRPISAVSISELDLMHPERLFVAGTGPELVAEIGDADDGTRLVEFYPYPLRNEAIMFTYYQKTPDLLPGSLLPHELDVEALKMGVLIDVYRYEMAKSLRANQVEVAAVWRNECRAQETTWEKRIEEMLRVDRASDDISVILHTMGPPVIGDFTFLRTARQDAISRLGNFP